MMKQIYFTLILLGFIYHSLGAQQLRGKVLSASDQKPIIGATVKQKGINNIVNTDREGWFSIGVHTGSSQEFVIEHVGYKTYQTTPTSISDTLVIQLEQLDKVVDSVTVVSTGYQQLPRERATGSFSTVNRELFNQQVGPDILSRLPAIASSLTTDNSSMTPRLMVRGLSTIQGPKDPLIVLDNFPYEGDIQNINPNIVESITILKDAAASSIWGARAANGVIVITTKKGQFNRPIALEFNSQLTVIGKPNLDYLPQMSSSDYIDQEIELFGRGFYDSRIGSASSPVISPVVDLLEKVRNGSLSEQQAEQEINRLRGIDARNDFNRYMYKHGTNQQYYLGARGGSETFSWSSAAGWDRTIDNLGESYDRVNLRFENTYRPMPSLSLRTGAYYTQSSTHSGRLGYDNVSMHAGNIVPYMELADQQGNARPVFYNLNNTYINSVGQGQLLDWNYYPLDDWRYNTNSGSSSSMLATAGLDYEILPGLSGSVNYQYERQNNRSESLADEQSYSTRDYINRFTNISGGQASFPVPRGGILDRRSGVLNASSLRGQLSFDRDFGDHHISAIAGSEMRSTARNSAQDRLYGYNPNNLTSGRVDYTRSYAGFITGNNFIQYGSFASASDTRFLSQYANAAYTYRARYTLSASARRDASNLFGLTTNEQWNPFWSVGMAWKVSNERFFKTDLLSYLNIRATYGFSGNIDPAMVAVNTISFFQNNSPFTGRPNAQIANYHNPSLRWETSRMINVAVDLRSKNDRISASVEYFRKQGRDLFGAAPIDYTTGIPPATLRNVASMSGDGLDIELKTDNIRSTDLQWSSILNFTMFKDRIQEYMVNRTLASEYVNPASVPISGIAGKPVYAMFGYSWAGLDSENGQPQGYLDGQISTDYRNMIGAGTSIDELEYFGSSIPTTFGSFINSFTYKSVSLQIGLSYKFGYWFRQGSIHYTDLMNSWRGHSDYADRWRQPGDELHTHIPGNTYTTNSQRDSFYAGSSVLVEKADHIRLQFINLGYLIPLNIGGKQKNIQIYLNANNLGVLWRANKQSIDPDFHSPNSPRLIRPAGYTLGLRTNF
ncbi:SusC/RagA family TonB-linked outer membrane protein [Sphingobacterium chungjuense]|uniref:SusC/RagA family TonB-linked outer membrane protein n=1 Tax=Sphingobacterium chungjuense TaxID=2675553 RepID=UPI00140CE197|nr:SusC/RagA family TonB-linked outer membrane protein [Sphingobacterium chungjuense]